MTRTTFGACSCFKAVVIFSFLVCTSSFAESVSSKIGYITDLSGKGGEWAASSRPGAEAALREFNKVSGANCSVVFEDHQLDPKSSINAAQKLLNVDSVDALITEYSGPSIAVAPLAAKADKLHLYIGAAQSIRHDYPHSFRSFPDYEEGCRALANHFQKQKLTPIGLLIPNTEFGELCFKGATATGAELLPTRFNGGDAMPTIILSLKSKGAKSVIDVGIQPDLLNALKAATTLQWDVPWGAGVELFLPKVRQTYPQIVEKGVGFGFAPVDPSFLKLHVKEEVMIPEAFQSAYTHVTQLCRAVSSCKQHNSAGTECYTKELTLSPPMVETHFTGWVDRSAQLGQGLKVLKNGIETKVEAN